MVSWGRLTRACESGPWVSARDPPWWQRLHPGSRQTLQKLGLFPGELLLNTGQHALAFDSDRNGVPAEKRAHVGVHMDVVAWNS